VSRKNNYAQLLTTAEWHFKRQAILDRDNHSCQRCGSEAKLQVHHRYYIANRLPWHYPGFALITLCDKCHESEHEPLTFSTWEFICDELQLDSNIAPLFAAAFRERTEKSGINCETLMAGLIDALDDPDLSQVFINLGILKVQERDDWRKENA